ncbi:secretin N-terminal domain-containing protein [Pirellulales bacterium]|nr:secretin N-terminal domain-containing protein [Pirellulales bacterium]
MAFETLHLRVFLRAIAIAAAVAPWTIARAQVPADGGQPAAENLNVQLKHLSAIELHARLETTFGRKLPVTRSPQGRWMHYSVAHDKQSEVLISANVVSGELRLAGRPRQLDAWQKILSAIDVPVGNKQTAAVVTADLSTHGKVRQVVNLMVAQNAERDIADPADETADDNPLGSLLGPVEVNFIEGTRYLIIRGNPRDVARVREIIQQIEELSRIQEPRITIHNLKHVQSAAVSEVVIRAFDPAAGALAAVYGQILVIPLVRPNGVLLIGQQMPVDKASELLSQLDRPGESLTQFEVFRLKFAPAANALAVVERLFQEPEDEGAPALTPRAVAVIDARTNSLFVRAAPRDMAEVRAVLEDLDRRSGETQSEIRIFRLKNSVAADLAPVLQQAVAGGDGDGDPDAVQAAAALLQLVTIDEEGRRKLESGVLAGVDITADPRANALVVAAPSDAMSLLAALIEQLDLPPETIAELKVFTIKNGDAVSLAEMLQQLFGEPGEQGGDGGGGGEQQLYQLRLSVDERTNSIIAAGNTEEMIAIEAILRTLDTSDARDRENRVYRLKNASAEGVALALQDWIRGRRDVEETAPGVASPFQQFEQEVVVVPEVNSNSLIISAAPSFFVKLTEIIAKLDEQAPMVMIQVLIGEVRLGDADEFGVELGLQDSVLFDRSLLEDIETTTTTTVIADSTGSATPFQQEVIQSARLTPGFDFGDAGQPLGNSGSDRALAGAGRAAAQGIANFAVGRVSPDLGFGGLVLSASSDSVAMLLRALQESRRLEVLSRPQIMALDNQRGRSFVGEEVPFITGVQFDNFGNANPTVEFRNVGLTLDVIPRISPEGLVVMEVFANKSELGPLNDGVPIFFSPNGDPVRVPRIITTEAETTVSAVSGQTVVLSGLLTKRDAALHRRVPLLADIPLLGDLFRYDSTSTIRTELLIILTPHVVRNRHEAEMIKQTESARMSWCLSDVVAMHGNAGLRSSNDSLGAAEAETIYPEAMPAPDGSLEPMTFPDESLGPAMPVPSSHP